MTIPDEQAATARFLAGLAGRAARETHVSAIFVGDDTVWKLKKSVRLPFLDFTTVAARRHFLMRELELNQPAAPGIYRDVVPVARQPDGGLALGGPNAVDWVLRMARVPDHQFLDAIAARGGLDAELLDRLGDCIAAYHARLPPVADWNSASAMRRITVGNAAAARQAGLPGDRVAAWHRRMQAVIDAAAPVLTRRAANGRVRRCHGDLHLANLCLRDNKPVAFDALEFDEKLATIDVAYDLAFLLMDLDRQAGRPAANRVLNRYVAVGGDVGAVACLGLFLSQRAFIRAHVSNAVDGPAIALAYLAQAEAYLSPKPARVVAVGGLQAAGKTTLARALAPCLGSAPGALVVRSDEIRKHLFGVPPEQQLPPSAYDGEANNRTNTAVVARVAEAIRHGHSVVADSTFLDTDMRARLEAVARQAEVPFLGIWLQAPLPILEARLRARRNDASDATLPVLHRAARRGIGAEGWHAIDATDAGQALTAVRALVGRRT